MRRIVPVLFLTLPLASFAASDVADAAMRDDSAAVEKLIDRHADVNAPQSDGATALHWAVFQGDRDMVELLLHSGANPKAANREGSTPLWLACIDGDAVIVSELLAAGADANEKLPDGRTPLMIAARTGSVDAIKVLLDHGAQVNVKETLRGTTPIMWAADQGHAAAIKTLIDAGADIRAKSDPAERGRGPALGKANDPRQAVARQGAALASGQPAPGSAAVVDAEPVAAGARRWSRCCWCDAATAPTPGDDAALAAVGFAGRGRGGAKDGGALTPLVYAVLLRRSRFRQDSRCCRR